MNEPAHLIPRIRFLKEFKMTVKEIRGMARGLGIKNYHRIRKADLIRAIQEREGNSPCYQSISGCREHDCLWMEGCQS